MIKIICIGRCYANIRLMLALFMIAKYTIVDGKTIRLMLEPIFSVCITMADVVAFRCMADVIAIVLVHDIDRICK